MMRTKKYQMFAIAMLATLVTAAMPTQAQTYSALYNFGTKSGDALNPRGAVAQGLDGALYSTSSAGGANNWGSVFKVTPEGKEMVLYSFCSQKNCTDGNTPYGGLTLRPDGHFLGTTEFNGVGVANSSGTIFDVSPTGTLTTLHTFTGPDGAAPKSPPIEGPDGSFYGVTSSGGGKQNCGTIYRMTEAGFTLLYQFLYPVQEGCNPVGPLALGSDGNLYGTTEYGGTYEGGTVFRATLNPGRAITVTVLAQLGVLNGFYPDYLIEGNDGNFYGTASGSAFRTGTIFKMTPTGTLTTLYNLGESLGATFVGLGQASDGNLYGTASATVEDPFIPFDNLFQITPAGTDSSVYGFNCRGVLFGGCSVAQHPSSPPVQGTNGLLYGITSGGGTGTGCNGGCGVLYSWDNGLPAFVRTVPFMGRGGTIVEVLGQGFDLSTTVSFNGTHVTATVVSETQLSFTVPLGATTGFITVTTSSGTLTSNTKFIVTP